MDEIRELPWIEKYRPKSIKDVILPNKMKTRFTKILGNGNVPNMLMHSVGFGTGKTSTAKALCNDLDLDYLYINTSLNRGIDTLRDEITDFSTSMSFNSKLKVVILDEFDGSNDILQKALRAAIEDVHEVCRFIITCNNIAKIHGAIRDRCEIVDFNFMDEDSSKEMKPKIYKRLIGILKLESIDAQPESVAKLVEAHYPSTRSMIKVLQQFSETFGTITDDILRYKDLDDQLFDLIMSKNFTGARQFAIDRGYNYDSLYRGMFDHLVPKIPSRAKQAQAIIIIEDYMYRSVSSIDKEITFAACMLQLHESKTLDS